MSGWGHNSLTLPGSSTEAIKTQLCSRCGDNKPVSGGIQMTPKKWNCSDCWRFRTFVGYDRSKPKV